MHIAIDQTEALLVELSRGPAVHALDRLAEVLGCDLTVVERCVDDLVAKGLCERWNQAPGGPAAALTPFGAAKFGVVISEAGRWASRGSRARESKRVPRELVATAEE